MATVLLVPGFFGFANLGDLRYFSHVERLLSARWGISTHTVQTAPTGSLAVRASRLAEAIMAVDGPVHVVGHSCGGLDARLLAASGANLPSPCPEAQPRIRSVVTVATPHRGTPTARFFSTPVGRRLLRVLSLFTLHLVRRGPLGTDAVLEIGRLYAAAEAGIGDGTGLVDELYRDLLDEFSPARRDEIGRFFDDVYRDQALLAQITPEALDVFNSSNPDRPDVRYGSVVTRARRPGLTEAVALLTTPYKRASAIIYAACWSAASRGALSGTTPVSELHGKELLRVLGRLLNDQSNDGMVPTLSQPWGRLLAIEDADHLDVIGHYSDRARTPPHYDWLCTGTGFHREAFERAWGAVARFVLEQTDP